MYKLIHLVYLEIEYQKNHKRMKLLIVTHNYIFRRERTTAKNSETFPN